MSKRKHGFSPEPTASELRGFDRAIAHQNTIIVDRERWQEACEREQRMAHKARADRICSGRAPVAVAMGAIIDAGFLLRSMVQRLAECPDPDGLERTADMACKGLRDAIIDGANDNDDDEPESVRDTAGTA